MQGQIYNEFVEILENDPIFESENQEYDYTLEDFHSYKLVLEKVKDSKCHLTQDRIFAIKSISAQLDREDNHGWPEFEKFRIKEILHEIGEASVDLLEKFYPSAPKKLEVHKLLGSNQTVGTNFQVEYDLIIDILSDKITNDLNIAVEQVRNILLATTSPTEWYRIFLGEPYQESEEEDYDIDAKDRIDSIVRSVVG